MKYSHSLALYNAGVCDLDNQESFKNAVEDFKDCEKYFFEKGINLEEIRKSIIFSFKHFNDLNKEERKKVVLGVMHSKNYVNEEDLYDYLFLLKYSDNSEMEDQTIFRQLNWKQTKEIYFPEEDSIDLLYEDVSIMGNQLVLDSTEEGINVSEKEKENLLNAIMDDEIQNGIEMGNYSELTPKEKLKYAESKYEEYKEQVFSLKKYSKEDKKLISKGMDKWFNYMLQNLKDLYKIDFEVHKMNSRSLIKNDLL